MNCSKCSASIGDGMRFCPGCGAPAGAPAPATQPNVYDFSIDFRPSYSVATVTLKADQAIRAEAGVMVSMSPNVELTSKMEGGLMGALKRVVTRESIFQSTFTAKGAPGEVLFAPNLPGDVEAIHLANQSYLVQSSSYLAGDPSIPLETKFSGMKGMLSGEGLFFIQLRGTGTVLISSFGAIVKKTLEPGQKYIVDTGYIVAFEESIQYTLRKASNQGWLRSFVSGEGVVAEYTGPGSLYLQTRDIRAFTGQLIPFLPTQQGNGGGGINIGKLFGS